METDIYEENEGYEVDELETEEPEEEEIESSGEDLEEDAPSLAASQEDDEEKSTIKKNLAKFKREFFRANAENQELKERLNQASSQFNEFSFMQAENSGKLMLEKARLSHKKALEEDDFEGYYRTLEDISRAHAQLENLKALKAQQDSRERSYSPEYNAPALDPDAQEWLEENPWYNTDHPDFDAQKQLEIGTYAQKLDDYLVRSGRQHEINSPAYFEKINQKVRAYDQRNNGRIQTMKSPSVPVAPVRGGVGSIQKAPQKKKFSLSHQHRLWADELKMSHDEYAKYVLEYERENEKYGPRGRY
jgi:hypothetical protein